MGEIKLTKAQQNVVDARDCSLLVAAAAGSGKTAVLVRRIIERLRSGSTSLDRLLIVTFTKAAASEMRERIGKAIAKELDKDPQNIRLKEQAALLSEARISTIDSFCSMVVRENFQALGIDPGFSVMEPAENDLIMDDVLEELFEEEYENASDDFKTLISSYGKYKDDSDAVDIVRRMYNFAYNETRPEDWLNSVIEEFDKGLDKDFFDGIMHEFGVLLDDITGVMNMAISMCKEPAGYIHDLTAFEDDLAFYTDLGNGLSDYDGIIRKLNSRKWPPASSKQNPESCDPVLKQKARDLRAACRKELDDFRKRYLNVTTEQAKTVYELTRPAVFALVRITLKYMEMLKEAKVEKNAYSFADIEHLAFKILCEKDENGNERPSAVAKELATGYDEIMIDEYQDSSYLQEYMLKSVSGEYGDRIPNLFMVGDVKQSIYRFRQARPELFEEKYESFSDTGLHRKIDLSENFRSRKSVLDAVNILLAPVMRKDVTEIDYDSAAALHFGSTAYTDDDPNKPLYNTEFIFIDREVTGGETAEAEGEDEEPEESLDDGQPNAYEREALTVAKKIRNMIESGFPVSDGVTDGGEKKTRPARPGDFAILTRAGKKTSEIFAKALSKMLIPSVSETGTGFFDAVEIRKTLAFLRIMDNPYDDISFTAALFSPYGGFGTSDLAELRIRYGEKSRSKMLYECMLDALKKPDEEDALWQKIKAFMGTLAYMRGLNETLTVHEVIASFYERTGYQRMVAEMPRGDGKRGNLDILASLAEKYEKSSFAGLHDFIRYIDRLIEKKKDFGEAEAEASEDSVLVSTMHNSKGLEFPVVFACMMQKEFNTSDVKKEVLFHRTMGIAANQVDGKRRTKRKTIKQNYLQSLEMQKLISEELRILYVALTRAKEKLFIVGTVKKPEILFEKSRTTLLVGERPTATYMKGIKNFADFMYPTIFSSMAPEEIAALLETGHKDIYVTRHAGTEVYTTGFGLSYVKYDEGSLSELAQGGKKKNEFENRYAEDAPADFKNDPDIRKEIEAQQNFVYPNRSKINAPMRVSVSALKHIEIENLMGNEERVEDDAPVMPGIPSEGKRKKKEKVSDGALRGTLYHEVFEKLRYNGDYSTISKAEASVKADVKALIEEKFLEADILKTVSAHDIAVFCMSGIGKRMIEANRAGKLHREQPFVYGLTPEDYRFYSKTTDETDMVMVQGIIDAYIEDEDGIVLVDYKTDKVYNDAAEELTAKYRVQLEFYAKALNALTSKKIKEKVIYSVTAGIDIVLN